MDIWTEVRFPNRFCAFLSGYIGTILYADNVFNVQPPLHYQMHGLETLPDDFTLYMFGNSSLILELLSIKKSVETISSLKLWRKYKRWAVSAYVCVISTGTSILTLRNQVKSFIHSLPTLNCKPVFIFACEHTEEIEEVEHGIFQEIRSLITELNMFTEYSIICKCNDIQEKLNSVIEDVFWGFLPLLDDKVASFEKQISEDIERAELDSVKIEEKIISILKHLNIQDVVISTLSTELMHRQIFNKDFLMPLSAKRVNTVHMVFDIIEENLNIPDRSILQRAIEVTSEKHSGENVRDKIISLCYFFVVELYTTTMDVTFISSLISITCILYQSSWEYELIVKETLLQCKRNAPDIARDIAYIYENMIQKKSKFKNELEKFRVDLRKLLYNKDSVREIALLSNKYQSLPENIYICKRCNMRHFIHFSKVFGDPCRDTRFCLVKCTGNKERLNVKPLVQMENLFLWPTRLFEIVTFDYYKTSNKKVLSKVFLPLLAIGISWYFA